MDGHQFDTLVKGLGRGASRRTMLQIVGAAAVGGVLGGLGQRAGLAAPPCPSGYRVCGGRNGRLCYAPPQVCCRNRGDNFIGAAEGRCAPPLGCLQCGSACSQDSECCDNGFGQQCGGGTCCGGE